MTGKRSNLLRKRRRDSPLILLSRLGGQKAVTGFCIDNCTKPSLFCASCKLLSCEPPFDTRISAGIVT